MPTLEEVKKNAQSKGYNVEKRVLKGSRRNRRVWDSNPTSPSEEDLAFEVTKKVIPSQSDVVQKNEPVQSQEPVSNSEPVSKKKPVLESEPVLEIKPVQEPEPVSEVKQVSKEKPVCEIKRPDFTELKGRIFNEAIITKKTDLKLMLFYEMNCNREEYKNFGMDLFCNTLLISKGSIKPAINRLVEIGFICHKKDSGIDRRGVHQENLNFYKLK